MAELGQCDALPAPFTTGALVALRREVTATLGRLADLDPPLMGLPPHPSAQEIALREAAQALGRAIGNFETVKKQSQTRVHGSESRSDDFLQVLRSHADGARAAARRIATLGGPAPSLPTAMNEYFSLEAKP